MTFPLNADLHCHSTTSDGTLTPEQLAARAAANGVDLWALTDHDEVGGQQKALEAARAQGMKYLTGVEISVTFADVTVHIVGLGFDHTDPRMTEGLADTRDGRGPRARAMAEQLAQVGIHGAYEGALKYVGNPRLISRTHFARFLVDSGVCRDTSEVFRKFLTEGKPGYVPHRWAKLGDAVKWITQSGGVAVIAHPARYKFTPNEEYALFSEFKQHGGQGGQDSSSVHGLIVAPGNGHGFGRRFVIKNASGACQASASSYANNSNRGCANQGCTSCSMRRRSARWRF